MQSHKEILENAFRIATEIAVSASNHVLQYWPYQLNPAYNKSLINEVYQKDGIGNVATLADKQSEEMIIGAIKSEDMFKDHSIVAEESEAIITDSEYSWHIDPIDGTSSFRNGLPEFGISIGLLYRNEPIMGVITRPALRKYIAAKKGEGARLYSFSHEVILELSNKSYAKPETLDQIMIGYDTTTPNRLQYVLQTTRIIGQVNNMLTYGSSCAALFRLALGQLSSYIQLAPHTWDIAAAGIIIPEIGGIVTNIEGKSIDWTSESPEVLASYSPKIHEQVIEILHKMPTN